MSPESSAQLRFRSESRQAKNFVNCSVIDVKDTIDRCSLLATYSHTNKANPYPTTIDELKAACPRHNEGLQCIRQHVKCLTPMTKRAMLGFVDSRRRHIKSLCSDLSNNSTRDFLEAFSCIKKVSS